MDSPLSLLVNNVFNTIVAKDIEKTMGFFHHNAEFIDPHYPVVTMKGIKQIREGFLWGFRGVKSFQFEQLNYFENKTATSASIEFATTLILKNGKQLNYQQVFIIETHDNKISRCQAYETYGPHGMLKFMLIITRLINKIRRV
jgi:ketosteroid isomerase-like protein